MFKGGHLLLSLFVILFCPWSMASVDKDAAIKDFFQRLHKNPVKTITAPPERWGTPNRKAPSQRPRPQQIRSMDFGEIDHNNKLARFYPENDHIKDFAELSKPELHSKVLELDMWSDDYWPTYKMGLAKRYNDEKYPNTKSYNDYIDYFKSLGPIDFEDPETMLKMSPAEKYDLLVLDSQLTLTNWSLYTSQSAYTEKDGKEEAMTWAGLCHGWAPAAYSVPRPTHSVKINLGFGEVEFYPSDIKALATLLWAQAPVPNRFLGGRCNTKEPDTDEFGRVTDPECFDINPSSWHSVLVNHLGIRGQSFVLDATYDLEVWNQPIKAYQMVYFNPQTQTGFEDATKAITPIEEFESDTFKAHRSDKTKYVVGVMLDIQYLVETSPSARREDSAVYDGLQTVRYFYDLELDENHKLIGGEWYHTAHPDFIWTPMDGAKAESWFDRQLQGEWSAEIPPTQWQAAAHQASRQGFPLAKIVDELIRRSRAAADVVEPEAELVTDKD